MSSIVVTGAGSGMGKATVERYLAEGWDVLALDIAPIAPNERVRSAVVDVRQRTQVADALKGFVAATGEPLGVVANVAGIYPPTTLDSFTDDLYRRTFDVNVLGVLNVTAAAMPHLVAGSSIVNFASIDGLSASPGQLLYSASKAAVIMITKSTAGELAPRRIRANAIAPGWVDSPGNRATGRMEEAAGAIPLGRVGRPDEIADWVWILGGSGQAGFMTGETIVLSGGDYMR